MRTAVRVAWRGAAMVAFGATAALAVALGRPALAPAALTTTVHQQPVHACTATIPRVRAPAPGAGHARCARAAAGPGSPATSHAGPAVRHVHPVRPHPRHRAAVRQAAGGAA